MTFQANSLRDPIPSKPLEGASYPLGLTARPKWNDFYSVDFNLQEIRNDPRRRSLAGLLPLTFVCCWLFFLAARDHSGPFHGMVLRVLAVMAAAGCSMVWIGLLRSPKIPTKS
jgi:hypothetical protein